MARSDFKTESKDPRRQTIAERFNIEQYDEAGLSGSYTPLSATREKKPNNQQTSIENVAYESPARTLDPSTPTRSKRRKKKKQKVTTAAKGWAYGRAVTVTIGIWSWATWVWLFGQLPMAFVSLLVMGAVDVVNKTIEEGGIITEVIAGAASVFAGALEYLLGIDLDITNLLGIIVVPWFIGIATLMAIWLSYTAAMLHPTSGEKAGLKLTMLLVAIIGYMMPFANLFPWFFLWTLVVMRHPK